MPYSKVYKRKRDGKFCVRNKETGKERCSESQQKAEGMRRLLEGLHHGWKPSGRGE